MEAFKLKVIIDNAQIELEGDSATVYKIFQELKEQGLGELSPLTKKNINNSTTDNVQVTSNYQNADSVKEKTIQEEKNAEVPFDFPTLQTILLQEKPSNEQEWILIYAVYCSQFGSIPFTAEDLRSKYKETNRFNESRRSNLNKNIKKLVGNNFFAAVDNSNYRLEKTGLKKAKEIISSEKKKNNSSSKSKANYQILELDLSENDKNDLRKFWNSHKNSSNMDKAVLIAYWLKKEKNIESYTANHLFTILRTIEENTSFDIPAALRNSKNNKNHFIYDANSNSYILSHIGEDYVKTLKNKDINNNE